MNFDNFIKINELQEKIWKHMSELQYVPSMDKLYELFGADYSSHDIQVAFRNIAGENYEIQ